MQSCVEDNINPGQFSCSEAQLCQEFAQDLILSKDFEEEDDEFSFMCGEANSSPIAAEDAFINGQIKPIFPLFNLDLLISPEDLPVKPPVKRVFVEKIEEDCKVTSSSPGNDQISGPYCDWSNRKAVEVGSGEGCQKSNSTGFSKIWRFKDLMRRSNSAGRDAFIFLNNGLASTPAAEKVEKQEAVKVSGKVKKRSKSKTVPLSPHEVYLKSKAKEEVRRRSYLPYRPEFMGLFTNVNGGLTKNVHPF